MKNTYRALFLIVLLLLTGVVLAQFFRGDDDAWLCKDGEWVKQGNPREAMPESGCGQKNEKAPVMINIDSPEENGQVSSPLAISGEARGAWYFEADFPIKLIDNNGIIIAQGIATAQGDWMTEEFVPFTAELIFDIESETQAQLVFEKDNPSGLSEYDEQVSISVILIPQAEEEKTTVQVFFMNSKIDPSTDFCERSYAVSREIPKTQAVGKTAIEELLKGPTVEEMAEGNISSINEGVVLKSLVIEDGVAVADFNSQLGFEVGGSCKVASIRSQITNTLTQFPTVDEVVISIDGETEEVLQP